jgi:epoxyqueuosine reductase
MTIKSTMEDPAAWIEAVLRDALNDPAINTLRNAEGERAWAEPLVGFSRGDDPIFERFKEAVGEFHWTPLEAFGHAFPGLPASAGELTVISWVLPQTEATKQDNRQERVYPAERWARSRIFGEQTNNLLRDRVVNALQAQGIEAAAPMSLAQWASVPSDRYVFASTWSERHAAFASGLGTFGLCDGLITTKGKAMRVGSAVARLAVPPTPRPYADHRAYCLFFSHGICGQCIDRCPAGAISEAGHDKHKCSAHLDQTRAYVRDHYGFEGYGCGLCQTGVPCESKIPRPQDV